MAAVGVQLCGSCAWDGSGRGSPVPSPVLGGRREPPLPPAPRPGAGVPPLYTERHGLQNPLPKSLLLSCARQEAAVLLQVGIPKATTTRPKERRCRRKDRPSRRFLCTNNFLFVVFIQDTQPKIAQNYVFNFHQHPARRGRDEIPESARPGPGAAKGCPEQGGSGHPLCPAPTGGAEPCLALRLCSDSPPKPVPSEGCPREGCAVRTPTAAGRCPRSACRAPPHGRPALPTLDGQS